MKVRVFLFTFNRPDLLPIQVKSIQKFLQDDYEIVVVHDSRNNDYVLEFKKICKELNIKFYHHNSFPGKTPSQYHGEMIQWVYDEIIKREIVNNLILFLDHDMFMVKNLSLINFLGNHDIAGRQQTRGNVEYVWPGLMFFKYNSIKDIEFNFYPGQYFGEILDTGGGTCYILRNKAISYKKTNCEYPEKFKGIDLLDKSVNLGYGFEYHLDKCFLHFRNACGWHNKMQKDSNDDNKKRILEYILNTPF